MKAPIYCPPRVDTFLAVAEIKPIEPEEPRKTVEEVREIKEKLLACLDAEMPEDFWD